MPFSVLALPIDNTADFKVVYNLSKIVMALMAVNMIFQSGIIGKFLYQTFSTSSIMAILCTLSYVAWALGAFVGGIFAVHAAATSSVSSAKKTAYAWVWIIITQLINLLILVIDNSSKANYLLTKMAEQLVLETIFIIFVHEFTRIHSQSYMIRSMKQAMELGTSEPLLGNSIDVYHSYTPVVGDDGAAFAV